MKKRLFFLFVIITILPGFGLKCTPANVESKMQPITLNYWRVWDGPDAFADIIANYNKLHPFITINYRQLRYDEYEKELIEAFATDRGPDIFSIQNTWVRKYKNKGLIVPMPAEITMVYPITKGSIKKEVIPELKTKKSITLKEIKNNFVDVVYDDVVVTENGASKVYGLPLSIDTMALFYNKDLFNNAGISSPAEYWDAKFQSDVKKLTKQNNKGEIVQSGVALGGGKNINRSFDILSVLMMQNYTEMIDQSGAVKFQLIPENLKNKNYSPGIDALRFYTDFSNPGKEIYCWNKVMGDSLDLFSQGKIAMMFGYPYMLPQIKANAPKLNFAITKLPQIEGNDRVNFANYWTEVVSSKIISDPKNLEKGKEYAKNKNDAAWDFIQYMTGAEQVQSYLNKTKKTTALRSLVDKQKDDLEMGIFAEQVLTAKSWYKGNNALAAEKIMEDLIDQTVTDREKINGNLNNASAKIQQTIN